MSLKVENIKLVMRTMYPMVLRAITDEETGLFVERMGLMKSEMAARTEVVRVYGINGLDCEVEQLHAEVKRLACLSEDLDRRLGELSGLEAVVLELQGLEGGASEFDGCSMGELRSVSEGILVEANNVLSDWCGGDI